MNLLIYEFHLTIVDGQLQNSAMLINNPGRQQDVLTPPRDNDGRQPNVLDPPGNNDDNDGRLQNVFIPPGDSDGRLQNVYDSRDTSFLSGAYIPDVPNVDTSTFPPNANDLIATIPPNTNDLIENFPPNANDLIANEINDNLVTITKHKVKQRIQTAQNEINAQNTAGGSNNNPDGGNPMNNAKNTRSRSVTPIMSRPLLMPREISYTTALKLKPPVSGNRQMAFEQKFLRDNENLVLKYFKSYRQKEVVAESKANGTQYNHAEFSGAPYTHSDFRHTRAELMKNLELWSTENDVGWCFPQSNQKYEVGKYMLCIWNRNRLMEATTYGGDDLYS